MLEPGQMHAKLHEVLIKNGVSNSPTLSSEIYASCLSHPNKDSDLAVLSILNSVDKAHKNDAKSAPKTPDEPSHKKTKEYANADYAALKRR
jgi:hypothetical protein